MTTTGLQCPSCGHVHPLADVAGQGRFRCGGCKQLLSVPESVEAASPDGEATRAHPAATPGRAGTDRRPAVSGAAPGPGSAVGAAGPVLPGAGARVPGVVRALVWVIALGLGFVVAAGMLRVVGLFDVDAVLDAFAGEGVKRYGVLLVLLPLWAVLSAGGAHLVLEWAGLRWDRRGRAKSGRPDAGSEKPQSKKDEGARRAV